MPVNLQEAYLAQIKNQVVSIYLVNGYHLRGLVRGYDNFTILLETSEGIIQMVYKHSVTTVKPLQEMDDQFIAQAFRNVKTPGGDEGKK